MIKKELDALVQKEVTRKEFLTTLGFGAASLMGLGTIVRILEGKHSGGVKSHKIVANSYGYSVYGGLKRPQL